MADHRIVVQQSDRLGLREFAIVRLFAMLGEKATQAAVAERLGIDRREVANALRVFEAHYGALDGPGTNGQKELFKRLDVLIDAYEEILWKGPLRIRVGIHRELDELGDVRRVLKRFEEAHSAKVRVITEPYNPEARYAPGGDGDLDIVLTIGTPPVGPEAKPETVALRAHLVTARTTGLDVSSPGWSQVRERMVLLPAPSAADVSLANPAVGVYGGTVVHVASFREMHRRVRCEPGTFCMSYPELFSPEDRQHLEAMPLYGGEAVLPVTLYRPPPGRAFRLLRGPEDDELIGRLFAKLKNRLQRTAAAVVSSDLWERLARRRERFAYHSMARAGGGPGRPELEWREGRLDLRVTSHGHVSGEHRVALGDRGAARFQLSGHLHSLHGDEFHLLFQGTSSGLDYSASLTCKREHLASDSTPLVGLWISRQWEADAFFPAGGFIIVSPQPCSDARQLNAVVQSLTRCGALRYARSGEDDLPQALTRWKP